MTLGIDVDALTREATHGTAKSLREKLEALDWSKLDLATDLVPLRRVLQRLELRVGVRPTHRWVSNRVLSAAKTVRSEHTRHHNGMLTAVSMSPDGRWLVTANNYEEGAAQSENGFAQLWEVDAAKCMARSEPVEWGLGTVEGGGLRCAQWSPDNSQVAVSFISSSVAVFARENFADPFAVLLGDSGIDSAVHYGWSPDSKRIAVQFGAIRTHPLHTGVVRPGKPTNTIDFEPLAGAPTTWPDANIDGWFQHLEYSASLPRVVCATRDEVHAVDTSTGALVAKLGKPLRAMTDEARFAMDPTGHTVVCARKGELVAVDLASNAVLVSLGPHAARASDVRWDAFGERLAVVRADAVTLWDPRGARELGSIAEGPGVRNPRPSYAYGIIEPVYFAFGRTGATCALVTRKGHVHVYDESLRQIAVIPSASRTCAIAYGADDRVLVTWGEGILEFWDLAAMTDEDPAKRATKPLYRHDHTGTAEGPFGRSHQAREGADWWTDEAYKPLGLRKFPRQHRDAELDRWRGALSHKGRLAFFALFQKPGPAAKLVAPSGFERPAIASSAFVLDEAHAWPFAWALDTKWASIDVREAVRSPQPDDPFAGDDA